MPGLWGGLVTLLLVVHVVSAEVQVVRAVDGSSDASQDLVTSLVPMEHGEEDSPESVLHLHDASSLGETDEVGRGRGKKTRRIRTVGRFFMRTTRRSAGGAGEEEDFETEELGDAEDGLTETKQTETKPEQQLLETIVAGNKIISSTSQLGESKETHETATVGALRAVESACESSQKASELIRGVSKEKEVQALKSKGDPFAKQKEKDTLAKRDELEASLKNSQESLVKSEAKHTLVVKQLAEKDQVLDSLKKQSAALTKQAATLQATLKAGLEVEGRKRKFFMSAKESRNTKSVKASMKKIGKIAKSVTKLTKKDSVSASESTWMGAFSDTQGKKTLLKIDRYTKIPKKKPKKTCKTWMHPKHLHKSVYMKDPIKYHWFSDRTCTSCQDDHAFAMRFYKSKAGACVPYTKTPQQICIFVTKGFDLYEPDRSMAVKTRTAEKTSSRSTSMQLLLSDTQGRMCTKAVRLDIPLRVPARARKAWYASLKFSGKKFYGRVKRVLWSGGKTRGVTYQDMATARCLARKEVVCDNGGTCNVKKTVKCQDICPNTNQRTKYDENRCDDKLCETEVGAEACLDAAMTY